MKSLLFVVSEQGYWGEECVLPLEQSDSAGLDLTVGTPTGQKPEVDERSVDPENVGKKLADRVTSCHRTHPALQEPHPLGNIDPDDFDAAVFPGGHGTLWDINADHHARTILRHMVNTGSKKALVVCHAVGILAFTRNSDGSHLVNGRNVTGFPNDWEEGLIDENEILEDGRKLPYWVENEVKEAGGNWDAELDKDESVTVDGDLVTARGPASSSRAADVFLEEIGVQG